MRSTSLVLTAASLLVLAACGGGPAAPPPQTVTISSSAPSFPATTPPPTSPSTTAKPPVPGLPPQAPPGPGPCRSTTGWSAELKQAAGSTTDALYLVRAGRHECFDRVVFDINGPTDVGYFAQYVPVVRADGSGAPIPVAGAAALQIVISAPAQGADESGHQAGKVLARTGDHFYTESQLAGWRTLRAVRFAGFFEGQCTFAVGVRAELPFRVFTLLDRRDQVRRVVVDIAH